MASNFVLEGRSLSVEYTISNNAQGNPIYQVEKLDQIKPTATDEQMYDLGTAIGKVLLAGGGRSKVRDRYKIVTTA